MIAKEVCDIIKNGNIPNVDPLMVFAYSTAPDVQSSVSNKIVILITEISNRPSNKHGSDSYITKLGLLQVQIFYPLSVDYDTETTVEDPLLELMESNKWFCVLGGQVDRDPQTSQLFTTFHFQKEKERVF